LIEEEILRSHLGKISYDLERRAGAGPLTGKVRNDGVWLGEAGFME
jgi:hypothetical protein